MATFVLIPGAGSDSWYWHLVAPRLREAGHEVVAVDLPNDDDAAGIGDYAAAVVAALGDRPDPVVVAQSMGGLVVPTVAEQVALRLIVLVAAMVPAAGESPGDWWVNTGHAAAFRARALLDRRDPDDWDPSVVFLHDVPAEVAEAGMAHVRDQSATPFTQPFPMPAWPKVTTRFLLCRGDRFFPPEFQRRVVEERLGFAPDEMDGGHLPALAHPDDLARRLLVYEAET